MDLVLIPGTVPITVTAAGTAPGMIRSGLTTAGRVHSVITMETHGIMDGEATITIGTDLTLAGILTEWEWEWEWDSVTAAVTGIITDIQAPLS